MLVAKPVNLDALIRREDFEVVSSEGSQPSDFANSIKATDLGSDSFFYPTLRKPDFQRETANWTPDKVAALIESFISGDLIPSVIMWQSPASGDIFVIDGAHRLSALIAWVQDDYGDGDISLRFFGNNLPRAQLEAAMATRKLVEAKIGAYAKLRHALHNQDTAEPELLHRAKKLSAHSVTLQWVKGTANKAESSFLKINQQAAPIEPTELDMIQARHKPNVVAARAFMRAGTGHKYWSAFENHVQRQVEDIASEVHELLFNPHLDSTIKSVDLPVGGQGYSADSLKMILELVNYVNGVSPGMWRQGPRVKNRENDPREGLSDDRDGTKTIEYMKAVQHVARRIAGNEPGSLALHPAVYFYSATGQFSPPAFLATVRLIKEVTAGKSLLRKFTEHRREFEEFLVRNKHFANQLVRAHGGIPRSIDPIYAMFCTVREYLGNSDEFITEKLKSISSLNKISPITEDDRTRGRNFSRDTKNSVYLREVLDRASRCGICSSRLPLRLSSIDHIHRRQDGGLGSPGNAQITHPYCNTGYKEYQHSIAMKGQPLDGLSSLRAN